MPPKKKPGVIPPLEAATDREGDDSRFFDDADVKRLADDADVKRIAEFWGLAECRRVPGPDCNGVVLALSGGALMRKPSGATLKSTPDLRCDTGEEPLLITNDYNLITL